ncbi:MAG: hypothetical protein ISEC1_P0519 [Thiomicrorhabdus sp.]|nr:MAG: hypothetical protein ISEC1_P0519 [Thiomicrorhabdus sp.]
MSIDDYKNSSVAATQPRQFIVALLYDEQHTYINSVSYEAYLNTNILLKGIDGSKSLDLSRLTKSLENLRGLDFGLSNPVSWDGEKR